MDSRSRFLRHRFLAVTQRGDADRQAERATGYGAFALVGDVGVGKSAPAIELRRARHSRAIALGDSAAPMPPRKSSLLEVLVSVPQTDTGRLG